MTKAAQNLNSVQIAMTQTYRSLGNYPATANANAATQQVLSLLSLILVISKRVSQMLLLALS
ncbi:toxin co-regulated pilin [Vibrio cholerae]|nr:toxin co-regulated pilin [Vibrio cholerae]